MNFNLWSLFAILVLLNYKKLITIIIFSIIYLLMLLTIYSIYGRFNKAYKRISPHLFRLQLDKSTDVANLEILLVLMSYVFDSFDHEEISHSYT